MNPEAYEEHMTRMVTVAQLALGCNQTEVLRALDKIESVGPFADPTFFVQTPNAFRKLRHQREIAEAVRNLACVYAKCLNEEKGPGAGVAMMEMSEEVFWPHLNDFLPKEPT